TVEIYWRCLAARQQLQVLDSDQHALDDFVSSLETLVENGQVEPTQLDRAVANQAVQRVVLSRATAADLACRRELAVAMGMSPDGALPTPVGEFPAMEGLAPAVDRLSPQALADMGLAKRQDLMALARFGAAESEHVRGAENRFKPEVNL